MTAQPVHAASGVTWTCGLDGWLGIDAGAAVRGGLRFAQELGSVSGGTGGFDRRWNFNGFFGGAFRRRIVDRTRGYVATRGGVRVDVHGGGVRGYHALYLFQLF